MATVTHLDTDVSIDAYNMTQKIEHMPGVVQSVAILNSSEASDNPPYAADRSVSLIFNEGTTSEVEKYTSDMLVKVPVTQISGVIHDFKPLMLSSFQISENFAAWQDFKPSSCSTQTDSNGFKYIDVDANKFHLHMDEWGRYTISGLNFAEGQNLIAFKLCNRAQYSSNQVCKVIQNTIPMQASQYLPEANYMTNNPYQPIGVEFNKSTYYEDAAGMVQITSFEVDNLDCMADANITSEIDGAYHPYASVNYTPKTPLSDGEHAIVVDARSDVGVSQAIWSFFVDTQPPTISIEALQPYSPRAPNTQPISIRYTTADNLSTFLRNITVKLFDPNGHFVTKLASIDSQAAGDNFVSVDPASLESLADGTYTIKIKAYDEAGNATTESIALILDSTPPTIESANVSPKPMTSNSDAMNFNASISENSIVTIKMIDKASGVASAYIAQAQGAASGESATAFYSWPYNNQFGINGPADGLYRFEITAQDAAGNVCDPFVIDNVRIDRTPPVIFSNACLPYVLSNTGDNPYQTTLNYQVSESNDKPENQSGNLSIQVSLYNENTGELIKTWNPAPADTGEVNSVTWNGNSANYGKGAYKFQITATDAYGNSSTTYSTCVKDGIAPIIDFPATDQTVTGTIAIRGTAVDPDWTNNLPFKDYRIYYAKGNIAAPANLSALSSDWQTQFVEVPEVNRDPASTDMNISIRPMQNDSTLAYFYSNGLANGTYTILLIAEEDGGQISACTRVIEVSNDPMVPSTDVPVVKLNPLPSKIHFTADGPSTGSGQGSVTLPISFVNGIKQSNVNIEILPLSAAGRGAGGEVAFYKFQPGVTGNQYTGKPKYTAGQNLGYFIWCDNSTTWHIRWSADGQSHHFTGTLMGSGISNVNTINWTQSGTSSPMVTWDLTNSNGEQGIDFTADNNAMLIITPKIDEDPSNLTYTANNIYFGMTNATQSYLPVMISATAEGVAPEVVNWDGKLDTGGFVDSGSYTVRVRSEGADGVGLATDEAQVQIETDFDVPNVETVNQSFSPVGAPDRVSIYYNLTKDSYITAYVYQDGNGTPVATITSEAFVQGNLNPNFKHVLSWRGNYPNPDSSQFFTDGGYNIKLIATAADGTGQKEVDIGGITIAGTKIDGSVASLDPIGDLVPFNGSPTRIANGSSDYYFEARGSGHLFPPIDFNYSLTPFGKQYVTTYPYVPFAMLIHRGYKQVDVAMQVYLSGQIREQYLPANDTEWHTDYSNYSSLVNIVPWGFRDEALQLESLSLGPACTFEIFAPVDQVYGSRPIMSGGESNIRSALSGVGLIANGYNPFIGSGSVRDDKLGFNGLQTVTINFYTKNGDETTPNYILDTVTIPGDYLYQYVESDKGIFKAKIISYSVGRSNACIDVQAELEAPIKYSRLTNRFVPYFGFVDKNHSSSWECSGALDDIDRLGFPGNEFFNDSSAKPYDEYNALIANAAAKQGMSTSQLISMLQSLGNQKNYSGIIGTPACTLGWQNYLSDPITNEYGSEGVEFIPITTPDYGGFVINPGYSVITSTTFEMSDKTDPKSLFYMNFPASADEVKNFIDDQNMVLNRFQRAPTLWTGMGTNSPHELDTGPDSVTMSVESTTVPGQIVYNNGAYDYQSHPLNELYKKSVPSNTFNVQYAWTDISDQSVQLDLDNTTEATGGARLRGSCSGGTGLQWTTDDDPLLVPYGGAITSGRKTFNADGFSGESGILKISDPYVTFESISLQNMASPNMTKYSFWRCDPSQSSIDAYDPVDNQYLKYDGWDVTLKDLSGADNSDLSPVEMNIDPSHHINDSFKVKLNLDSAEKKFVEIRGMAAGEYYLMYFDPSAGSGQGSWIVINHSNSGANGTLGWWNVSRLNGKYTVLLKVGDVISTQDILIGSIVHPNALGDVTSPYKRSEVIFKQNTFPNDQLVTVTPVKMDEIDVTNRPLIPTIGPIVEVKPSPYYFQVESSEANDLRPTLIFRYTKDDLKEMYPNLNVDDPASVEALGLNIHQITANGDLQIISDNKQSYDGSIYAFEGPLDHFSDYALIRGSYSLKAPLVLTDNYITNKTPITVYGTAQADSILNIYVSATQESNAALADSLASITLASTESGIDQFKFDGVPLVIEGNNYIVVTSTKGSATTKSQIVVRYDITPPSVEASANLPAFSPNGDGKFDTVDYTIKSNEDGKMYFVIKDPNGNTVYNKELECTAAQAVKSTWDGTDQNSNHCADGQYTFVAFAVDEAGNISNNVSDQTIIDTVPPVISGLTASPNPFTPNGDGINDTTTISFEVSEPCYTTINVFRNDALFFSSGFPILYPLSSIPSFIWDGKGLHNELIGGTYSYQVVAEDSVGNVSTSETGSIYVDRAASLVQYAYADPLYFSPKNPNNNKTNIKYGLSRDGLDVNADVFDGTGTVVKKLIEDQVQKSGDQTVSWDGGGCIDGTYNYKVRAVDPNGGASSEVTGSVIIDTQPPTIAINALELTGSNAKITYSIPEIADVSVEVVDENGYFVALVTSETEAPGTHNSQIDLSTLNFDSSSSLMFRIFAMDKALNTDEKTSDKFKVPGPLEISDAQAVPAIFNPNSQIIKSTTTISYDLAAKYGSAQVSVKVISQAGATIKVLKDGEQASSGTGSIIWYGDDYNGNVVDAGNYTIQISAVDDHGDKANVDVPVIVASNSSSVLTVSPETFSPIGSGVLNTATFTFSVDYYWQLSGEAQTQLDVMDSNGNVVFTHSEHHERGTFSYVWDGTGASDGDFNARIMLVDPAGTIVYSNIVPIKVDMHASASLPSAGFVIGSPFTPNGDGQLDTSALLYELTEPTYVTVEVHTFSSTASYDATNLVKTIMNDQLVSYVGTNEVIWDGSTDGLGDTDGNGYVNKGEYVLILKTVDLYGNVSPIKGATVWVQDVPITLSGPSQINNPDPKVFSGIGGQTNFQYSLSAEAVGAAQEPELISISAD